MSDAKRARFMSVLWWLQAPLVCGGYLAVSAERWPERLIGAYIAFASIAAMAVTYSGKAKAADAEVAANGEDP